MDPTAALQAFAAVFPAELPDKTMVATLVLVTHHRRALPVWCGAAAAFTLHVVLAVTAGRFLRLLPDTGMALATAALFAIGAVLLWREAGGGDDTTEDLADAADAADAADDQAAGPPTTALAAFAGSFGVVGLAEAGDLTQLATAGIAARSSSPVAVGIGALAALWLVAGLAVIAGRRLADRLPVAVLQRVAAVVFAALSAMSLVSVFLG